VPEPAAAGSEVVVLRGRDGIGLRAFACGSRIDVLDDHVTGHGVVTVHAFDAPLSRRPLSCHAARQQ
jgi:hypothetical protein